MTLESFAKRATALAVSVAVYRTFLRRPILTWGATAEEAAAELPGDELLADPDGVATRAITIDAPRSAVWPWLAQMGPSPRGGAYTYDWIENLFGLNMHSADRVLPEFQHPEVGDGFGFGANRMSYAIVEPEHVLAVRSDDGNWVWTFVLEGEDGTTRLVSRNRFRLPKLKDRIGMLPMEPGSLVMERKMLRGIKERAEQLAAERVVVKRFDTPDEVVELPGGARLELVHIGGVTLARGTAPSGWHWAEEVGPTAETDLCPHRHLGVIVSGSETIHFADGAEVVLEAGDVYLVEPGHDSWISSEEPCVSLDLPL